MRVVKNVSTYVVQCPVLKTAQCILHFPLVQSNTLLTTPGSIHPCQPYTVVGCTLHIGKGVLLDLSVLVVDL